MVEIAKIISFCSISLHTINELLIPFEKNVNFFDLLDMDENEDLPKLELASLTMAPDPIIDQLSVEGICTRN